MRVNVLCTDGACVVWTSHQRREHPGVLSACPDVGQKAERGGMRLTSSAGSAGKYQKVESDIILFVGIFYKATRVLFHSLITCSTVQKRQGNA